MNKEFETWWITNKFRLMENDDVGVREIALAAYMAGKEAAEQSVQADFATCAPELHAKYDDEGDFYCRFCGKPLSR